MPNPPILAGLDLGAIGQGAIGETGIRMGAQQGFTDSYLAQALAEQQAGLLANQQLMGRDQASQRLAQQQEQQRLWAEQQLQAQWEAQQAEVQRSFQGQEAERQRAFEMLQQQQQQGQAEPDWFTQQRFQTDENIRQASTLAALEARWQRQAQKAQAEDEEFRLSDFGNNEVSPYRGQAVRDALKEKNWKGDWLPDYVGSKRWNQDLARVRELMQQFDGDPARVIAETRKYFGKRTAAASLALFDLGVRTG